MFVLAGARANTYTHLQTPVTLCREQSIRGYVSKLVVSESMYVSKVRSVGVPSYQYLHYTSTFLYTECV